MQAAEALCDRVAFIVDGQIKLIDSPRELKLTHGQRKVRVEYIDANGKQSQQFSLDNIGSNDQFSKLLSSYPIETIHSQEASLEQIFIAVTGRQLS